MDNLHNTEAAKDAALEFALDLLAYEQCFHPDAIASYECTDRAESRASGAEKQRLLKQLSKDKKRMNTTGKLLTFASGYGPFPGTDFLVRRFAEYLNFAGPEKKREFAQSGLSRQAVAEAVERLAPRPTVQENVSKGDDPVVSFKVKAARKWLGSLDSYLQNAFHSADDEQKSAERLLQHAAPLVVERAKAVGFLPPFPFPIAECGCGNGVSHMKERAESLADKMESDLTSGQLGEIKPLLEFFALHLLRAQYALFADATREAYWFERGDQQAGQDTDTPMYFRLFEMYLDHSGRRAEFVLSRLRVADVVVEGEAENVETSASLAPVFDETLVRLVDEARDRKALLSHKLARLEEGRRWRADRGSDLSEYERNYGDEIRALEAELAQVEVVLQTPGLDTAYWWARGVDDGLDDCEVLKPSIELVLKYWRGRRMARGVTADALFEEIFNTND